MRHPLAGATTVGRLTLAILLAAPVLLAQPAATPGPAALPDTAAGRCVAAYIAAFNTGDDATMNVFFKKNLAAAALAGRPIGDRLAFTRQLRAEAGSLSLQSVMRAAPDELVALLRTRSGELLKATFAFEPGEPGGLLGIRFEPAGPGDEQGPLPPMSAAEALAEVERLVAARAAADEFAGTVLVAQEGRTLLLKAWGEASREFGVANRTDTRYNLGSINKLFTKLAIGQLVQAGRLSFDTTLGTVLPDYPNAEARAKVTVRHLLTMRSGVGDFFGERYEATPKDRLRTNADFLPLFADQPLAFAPGSRQQYSNGGYIVLGAIIEKLGGQSYYDYLREHVFTPAGMNSTDSFEADVPVANLAEGYTRRWDGTDHNGALRHANIYTRPARGSAAGGGYSTAEDLLRFVNALLTDGLLEPAYTDWYLTGVEPAPGAPRAPRNRGGLGFAGGAPGINANLEVDLARGVTIVVLSNLDPPAATDVGRDIRRVMEAVTR